MKSILTISIILIASVFLWLKLRDNDSELPIISVSKNESQVNQNPVSQKKVVVLESPIDSEFSEQEKIIIDKIRLFFNTGNFQEAFKLADEQSHQQHRKNFIKWLQEQMPAILISKGWAELKLGHCENAVESLNKAELYGMNEDIAKALSYCYMKLGNFILAETKLSWLISKKVVDIDILMMFAEVNESLGQFQNSIELIDEYIETIQNKDDVETLNLRKKDLSNKAKESHVQAMASSKNFVIRYRGDTHEGVVDQILNYLEQSHLEFVEKYKFSEQIVPIEVVLYLDSNFHQVIDGSPAWSEGIFDGRMRIPVRSEWLKSNEFGRLKQILKHELIHALLAQKSGSRKLPVWFEEGLAQHASCETENCLNGLVTFSGADFLRKDELENSFFGLQREKVKLAYEQSLYLVLSLEQMNRYNLRTIVENLNLNSSIKSDDLLRPVQVNFEELILQSQSWWQERKKLIE